MKIEAIEATRSPNGKLRIRFADGKGLLVYPSVIAELHLSVGMEIPEAALESIQDSASEASARERALRILSASAVTEKELRRRLKQKGETEEHGDKAVRWLKDLELLDDRKAAEMIVAQGISKGYGEARLRQMLYEKGVPRSLWQEALEQLPVPDQGIRTFLEKRFRGKKPDRAEIKRATDALLRRGHKWNDIRRIMEEFTSEAEDEGFFQYDDSDF